MRSYIALIHKDADSDYGVSFPDLPGCVTAGSTLDEAMSMAAEAVALHLEGLAEDKQAAPEPSSLEQIMSDRENKDAVAVVVPWTDARAVRVNITLPNDLLSEVDQFAEANGQTRSGFLAQAARNELSHVRPVAVKVDRPRPNRTVSEHIRIRGRDAATGVFKSGDRQGGGKKTAGK